MVYEIVVNRLNVEAVKKAMSVGSAPAVGVPGIVKIFAGNYGRKLGPYRAFLKECMNVS